jgi:hypothetical protein
LSHCLDDEGGAFRLECFYVEAAFNQHIFISDICVNELEGLVRLIRRGMERSGLLAVEYVDHCKFEDRNFDAYFFSELKSFEFQPFGPVFVVALFCH